MPRALLPQVQKLWLVLAKSQFTHLLQCAPSWQGIAVMSPCGGKRMHHECDVLGYGCCMTLCAAVPVWDSSIVVAKFLEKQAALAAAAESSSSSSRIPGDQARVPAHSSTAQCCTADGYGNSCTVGSDTTEVRPPAAGGVAAVEGTGASAVQRQAAAAHPAACAALQPPAASTVLAGDLPVTAANGQEAEARAMSEKQQAEAGRSLQGKRCLDLSAGCGLVGK